ncbi:glycosyltransferase family 2 protein [Bacteroides sp. OttesenSCG-928-D19]|nr:glycosyltransferase family 2 protein [Bacteroides sp. OttesenSCG-928-N06]MDL2304877.1 glycosyltransferase family 2 protein [Bacteroides sp. OttesenSCG-928-D19]
MKLSVVIVNYNVKYYLVQCLESVYRAMKNIRGEVFVVDNASTDGSKTYFSQKNYPHFTYIYNTENVGFSRANNQAIRLCKGEYVLLLNPDTFLAEDTLTEFIYFMDTHPQAGASGPKMITSDGSFLPESMRGLPSPWNSFSKLMGLQRLFPQSKYVGGYYLTHLDNNLVHEVEILAGACMFLRRTVLEDCGLLSEDYFMYGEDIDLSYQVIQQGYKNYYLPLPVFHYKGESTSKDSEAYVRVFYRAMDVFFRKYGNRYNLLLRAIIKLGIQLRMRVALLSLNMRQLMRKLIPVYTRRPRFLIFGSEENLHIIKSICKRHNLSNNHCYIVSNEVSNPTGHHAAFINTNEYTHVVYDSGVYSYSRIMDLLGTKSTSFIVLGVYNSDNHILITPQKCYV